MTTPDQQARTLRTAIENQRAARETGREIAAQIARERETGSAESEDGEREQ